jgi:hypothetical protein
MFRFEADLTVFLHREPIDFRAYAKLATMQSPSKQSRYCYGPCNPLSLHNRLSALARPALTAICLAP